MYPTIRMDGLNQFAAGLPPISLFDSLAVLGEPVRCRALLVLEGAELTVSELCDVLQLPQSTASRHLKALAEDGWVRVRPEGTRRLYSAGSAVEAERTAGLWSLLRPEVVASPAAVDDARRLEAVLAERRSGSEEFFSSSAGEWSQMRRELFGGRFDLEALVALLSPDLVVGDLGTGSGEIAATLAPFVHRVIAVDASEAMLETAAERLSGFDNVELRRGRLEQLPIPDRSLDVAFLGLVLHHLAEPEAVIAEAARALAPGGRLVVLEMHQHERDDYRQAMGHVWLGFEPDQLAQWATRAGLRAEPAVSLSPDPAAKGPGLYVVRFTRPEVPSDPAPPASTTPTEPPSNPLPSPRHQA